MLSNSGAIKAEYQIVVQLKPNRFMRQFVLNHIEFTVCCSRGGAASNTFINPDMKPLTLFVLVFDYLNALCFYVCVMAHSLFLVISMMVCQLFYF